MSLYESDDEADETESGGFHPDPIPILLLATVTSLAAFGALMDIFTGQTGIGTAVSAASALFLYILAMDWIFRHRGGA